MENQREKIIPIRLSENELAIIQNKAFSEGLGLSPYIRRLVLLEIKKTIEVCN